VERGRGKQVNGERRGKNANGEKGGKTVCSYKTLLKTARNSIIDG